MFPLTWIFIAWIVIVGIFVVISLLTLAATFRYGLSCSWTYLIAGLFVAVFVAVVLMVLTYAGNADLALPFNPLSFF